MAARGQHGYTARIWIGAGLAHLALFGLWQGSESPKILDLNRAEYGDEVAMNQSSVALIELPSDSNQVSGTFLMAVAGASDRVGADPERARQDVTDAPGEEVGARASGVGGAESFADRSDSETRSATTWNTRGPTLMPHNGEARRGNTSAESLQRSPTTAYSDRRRRRARARLGAPRSAEGIAESEGQGGAPGTGGQEWLAADPRFDSAPALRDKFVSGAVIANLESAKMDHGARSTEQAQRGPATESKEMPSRSNRATASAFHLGAPSSGKGDATGARGKLGESTSGKAGSGSAAQSGQGDRSAWASTRASRSHPYFNEMYRRIDRELRFPKKLALALEQGDLVLSFKLDKRGRIQSLKLKKPSGFAEFDREALRAFRAAAPFGQVPDSLLGSRDRLAVIAPYYFRNPLIR